MSLSAPCALRIDATQASMRSGGKRTTISGELLELVVPVAATRTFDRFDPSRKHRAHLHRPQLCEEILRSPTAITMEKLAANRIKKFAIKSYSVEVSNLLISLIICIF